jgi:hypothetical protein
LPDGSYLAQMSGGGVTLTVGVIEYTVSVVGRDAPELCPSPPDPLSRPPHPPARGTRRSRAAAMPTHRGHSPSNTPHVRGMSMAEVTKHTVGTAAILLHDGTDAANSSVGAVASDVLATVRLVLRVNGRPGKPPGWEPYAAL